MAKSHSAAQANGMRNIEEAICRALKARGVDLSNHYFSWHVCSSVILHTDVEQLALHLRDGRILIHRFSIEEIEHASSGIVDLATLRRVHSIAETVSPLPSRC
jgi:hypothetical protein